MLRTQRLNKKCLNSKNKQPQNCEILKRMTYSSSINFNQILSASQIMKRSYTCSNFWVIRGSYLSFYTEGLFMGGGLKTFIHDAMASVPLYLFSKYKMGTASVVTRMLSGHHLYILSVLVIQMPCCSTSLAKDTSQANKLAKIYTVAKIRGLVLEEKPIKS